MKIETPYKLFGNVSHLINTLNSASLKKLFLYFYSIYVTMACKMDTQTPYKIRQLFYGIPTSIAHWIKNPLQISSEHNHKFNCLNFLFFHYKKSVFFPSKLFKTGCSLDRF